MLDISGPRVAFLVLEIYTFSNGGLDRLKSCGHGAFEYLAMLVHLVFGYPKHTT
jgi:hypothetical protein